MKTQWFFLVILGALLLAACGSGPTDSESPIPELVWRSYRIGDCPTCPPVATVPIDSTIQVYVARTNVPALPEHDSTVGIMLVTDRIYGCCNWSLVQNLDLGPRTIDITLKGIFQPEICLTALGPASSSAYLQMSPGTYKLRIGYLRMVDEYRVTVTDSSVMTEPVDTSFTHPGDTTVRFN